MTAESMLERSGEGYLNALSNPPIRPRRVAAQDGARVTLSGALIVIAGASGVAGAPAAEAAAVPLVSGSNGSVTVRQLAGKAVVMPARKVLEERSFKFRFPPGAAQGPDTWYLLRMDATVVFAPGSPPGSVVVSGYTGRYAGAQVEFFAERHKGGGTGTSWSTVDLLKGSSEGRSKGRRAHISYRNFAQIRGVEPGLSVLTFEVERFGKARVQSVEIGPESGVYATPAGPVELEVGGGFADDELAVGETGELIVEVSNKSPRIEEDIEVTVQPRSDRLFVKGPAQQKIERLDGSAELRFAVGRSQPGELKVVATAVAPNENEAQAVLSAEVGDDEGAKWMWLALLGLGALTAGAAAAWRRWRTRGGWR